MTMRRKADAEKQRKSNQAGRQSLQLLPRQCIATLKSGELQRVSSKSVYKFLSQLDQVQFTQDTELKIQSNNSRNRFSDSLWCTFLKWYILTEYDNIVLIFSYVQGTRYLFVRHLKTRWIKPSTNLSTIYGDPSQINDRRTTADTETRGLHDLLHLKQSVRRWNRSSHLRTSRTRLQKQRSVLHIPPGPDSASTLMAPIRRWHLSSELLHLFSYGSQWHFQ
jgi:hypothetical protein